MPIAYIYRLSTKIRSTMLCLSGFEQYSQWVPLLKYSRYCNCNAVTAKTLAITPI